MMIFSCVNYWVKCLENEGYLVDTVHCGESALEFIQSNPVDLVLLDVMLPNLSGFQVARRICQRFATPILMLTALNDDASMLDGYQAGADQYIAKPFNVPELLTRIKVILRRVGLSVKDSQWLHQIKACASNSLVCH